MAEIIAALDEGGANQLLDMAIAAIPPQSASGSASLGPFFASYGATATLVNGDVDLIPPTTIRIVDLQMNWQLNLSFGIDLNQFLPNFCLPQVCVNIPCVGRVCTPRICISWPTITVPVSVGDFLRTTADFEIVAVLDGGIWKVSARNSGIPNLQFGPTTALILGAIGLAVTPILLAIPFLGPFLAIAVNAILAAIGIAGITGLLGPILTPFVAGLEIPLYQRSQVVELLPAESAIDPAVSITVDLIAANVQHDGEDELVVTADISP